MTIKKYLKSHKQTSEAFVTAAFLSVSGGLQDAYTYISRGKVFANAQTGNIVLLSQHIFAGNWADVMRYLMPVLSFMFGVAAATEIRQHFQNIGRIHWRQIVILIEMSMLFLVGFLPGKMDLVANAFVSFSCAMQVQTFRKVDSYAFASTMCIGNLRSGMAALSAFMRNHKKQQLEQDLAASQDTVEWQQRSAQALDWFWQVDEAYVRGKYSLCRTLMRHLEDTGDGDPLKNYLPQESATKNGRFSPYHRYEEIYNALH